MQLDDAFEQELITELAAKHQLRRLPEPFHRELAEHETAHVIDIANNLYDPGDYRLDATELEHVIHFYKRPSLLVRNGGIEPAATDHWQQLLSANQNTLKRVMPSVGRIETKNYALDWVGSGFLIASDLVVTNRHVAEHFVANDGTGFTWKLNDNLNQYVVPRIDFLQEYGQPGELEIPLLDVVHMAGRNDPDIAILRLNGHADLPPIPLATQATQDTAIIVVGYPWKDTRASGRLEAAHKRIFNDIYGVKRAAPGKIVNIDGIKVSHDCSTLRGNSGSACLDIETGNLLAVHYGGEFTSNAAVDVSYLHALI